jgi:threonine dehydratase
VNRSVDAKTIVCVISGANIDSDTLATILRGEIPIKALTMDPVEYFPVAWQLGR